LLKGIKTTELYVSNTQVTTSPYLHDNFASSVYLYSTFIKQIKAENPQLNVSEVSFAHGKGGKNSFGKRGSSGMSNVSNAAVDERFFENHEYHALTPEQKNTLLPKRLKHGNFGNDHGGNDNGTGKGNGNGKAPTLKSLNRSIVALATKNFKFNLPNDDDDDDDDDDDESS
jgi:hypothetical protein